MRPLKVFSLEIFMCTVLQVRSLQQKIPTVGKKEPKILTCHQNHFQDAIHRIPLPQTYPRTTSDPCIQNPHSFDWTH